jgi:hypothetical protein
VKRESGWEERENLLRAESRGQRKKGMGGCGEWGRKWKGKGLGKGKTGGREVSEEMER